jgi:hypothetical protein
MKEVIKTVLPWIGTALGGPLGAGVATFIASKLGVPETTISETLNAMVADPAKLNEARQLDREYQLHLAALGYTNLRALEELNVKKMELDVRSIEAVNKTMQVEAAAEHWPTYSWRPFNGFMFGICIFGVYFLLPMLEVKPPDVPTEVWLTWGSILGIASYFRGKTQADPNIPPAVQLPPGLGKK